MSNPVLRAAKRASVPAPVRASSLERHLRRFAPCVNARVRALASAHPRLADLAVSFPGLLVALARPRTGFDPRAAIAMVIEGARLADLARHAATPMWLRKLPPQAFIEARPRHMPDGPLLRCQIANHLPNDPRRAAAWLQVVAQAAAVGHETLAVWTAREHNRSPKLVTVQRARLVSLWAWYAALPHGTAKVATDRGWTPDLQFNAALRAASTWHERVELYLELGDSILDDPWLTPSHDSGYDFVPLLSAAEMEQEAAAMQNCLISYGYTVSHARSRLWSVRRAGTRVGTLEVARSQDWPLPNIVQLRGALNAPVDMDVWLAARRWVHAQDRPGPVPVCKSYTQGFQAAHWQAMWRPYWLAKRHFPAWLPLNPARSAFQDLS
jgi:hypothetical protein